MALSRKGLSPFVILYSEDCSVSRKTATARRLLLVLTPQCFLAQRKASVCQPPIYKTNLFYVFSIHCKFALGYYIWQTLLFIALKAWWVDVVLKGLHDLMWINFLRYIARGLCSFVTDSMYSMEMIYLYILIFHVTIDIKWLAFIPYCLYLPWYGK